MGKLTKIENQNSLEILSDIPEILVWYKNIISPYTRKTYKNGISSFCKFFNIQNTQDFEKVKSIHIIEFRDALIESGMEKRSINNRLSALSSLFNHLIERQVVKINPVIGVKRMKKDSHKVESRCMDTHEIEAMLNQPNTETLIGLRDKAILSIMFNAGTRVGTIIRFKGKNIYEENGFLILDMHLKGDKRNKVAANSCIAANLKNYFEALKEYRQKIEGEIDATIPDEMPIFPQMSLNPKHFNLGKPISATRMYQMWKKYAKKAGIERTNPHCARTTFITNALNNGCDLQHVQVTAGHSDPRTTMSYNHNKADYKNSASLRVSFG